MVMQHTVYLFMVLILNDLLSCMYLSSVLLYLNPPTVTEIGTTNLIIHGIDLE